LRAAGKRGCTRLGCRVLLAALINSATPDITCRAGRVLSPPSAWFASPLGTARSSNRSDRRTARLTRTLPAISALESSSPGRPRPHAGGPLVKPRNPIHFAPYSSNAPSSRYFPDPRSEQLVVRCIHSYDHVYLSRSRARCSMAGRSTAIRGRRTRIPLPGSTSNGSLPSSSNRQLLFVIKTTPYIDPQVSRIRVVVFERSIFRSRISFGGGREAGPRNVATRPCLPKGCLLPPWTN